MKIALAAIIGCCLLLPGQALSQGCLGGDSDEEGMQIAGFFQPEFGYLFGEDEDAYSFSLRRARVAMFGNIPYDFSYYMCLEFSQFVLTENTGVLDAFITYSRLGPHAKFTLGQYKAPFSLEQNTSCSGLHTIRRSTVVNNLAGPQRDIGLMVSGSHKDMLSYSLALMNGTGIATRDNNKAKDLVGRVVVSPVDFLSVGASYRTGKHAHIDPVTEEIDPAADEDERERFGGEIEIEYGNLLVQGEFIQGEDIGSIFVSGG